VNDNTNPAADVDWADLIANAVDDTDAYDRRHQADRLRTVRDAFTDADAPGGLDAVLDAVCAIDDDLRKAYRHLGADDLIEIIRQQQRRATDAAVTALRTTNVVADLMRGLRTTGATTLGDLLATPAGSLSAD
jgi:hypothetical protein